jgi:hypothetical protein
VKYYARISRPGGPPSVASVYSSPSGGIPMGEAYYSGDDARGVPVWSLKVHGRWIGERWKLRGGEFIPV